MNLTDTSAERDGWMIWDTAKRCWRANPEGIATVYPTTTAMGPLGFDEMPVPMGAVQSIVLQRVTDASPEQVETTDELWQAPSGYWDTGVAVDDPFVNQLTGVLDVYAGLADVVLDRHVGITLCRHEVPTVGRTVSDVFADILQHIRTDHT